MKDTIKIENKKHTLMVAHRGASGIERENTLPAFIEAGKRSYFGEECDIHYTKDGKFVIYHDDTTERLCNEKHFIEETDFATLRALKIKGTDSEEFADLHMPTFEEYLSVIKKDGKVGVVELKLRMSEKAIAYAVELCKKYYSLDKIIFISFFFDNLVDLRKILPKQPVQFLTCADWDDRLIERLASHKFDLDIGYWLLTKERVEALHKRGILVNCWTCDKKEDAEQLIDWGVDFITTNTLE